MGKRMKNFTRLNWQLIEVVNTGTLEESNVYRKKLRRAKVPGGWLVESEVYDQEAGFGVGLTFMPDQKYDWSLEKTMKAEKTEDA